MNRAGGDGGEKRPVALFIWGTLVAALFGVAALSVLPRLLSKQPAPERYGPAPSFELTDQGGDPFSDLRLEGKVWVAGFMFTRCRGVCPLVTQRMKTLADLLVDRKGWSLVSFSVDPDHDTPDVLLEYARSVGADKTSWVFLTGDRTEIVNLVSNGFKLAVEDRPGDDTEPILHSPRLVLVDGAGEIRGYYDSRDEESMRVLHANAGRLLDRAG